MNCLSQAAIVMLSWTKQHNHGTKQNNKQPYGTGQIMAPLSPSTTNFRHSRFISDATKKVRNGRLQNTKYLRDINNNINLQDTQYNARLWSRF